MVKFSVSQRRTWKAVFLFRGTYNNHRHGGGESALAQSQRAVFSITFGYPDVYLLASAGASGFQRRLENLHIVLPKVIAVYQLVELPDRVGFPAENIGADGKTAPDVDDNIKFLLSILISS